MLSAVSVRELLYFIFEAGSVVFNLNLQDRIISGLHQVVNCNCAKVHKYWFIHLKGIVLTKQLDRQGYSYIPSNLCLSSFLFRRQMWVFLDFRCSGQANSLLLFDLFQNPMRTVIFVHTCCLYYIKQFVSFSL